MRIILPLHSLKTHTEVHHLCSNMDLNIREGEVDVMADAMLRWSMDEVGSRSHELTELFNGDVFPSLDKWPSRYVYMIHQLPITDSHCFQLFLFIVGNGGSPHLISEWILLSQYWSRDSYAFVKRANQLLSHSLEA